MRGARLVHIPQLECYFYVRDVAYGRQSDPGARMFSRPPGLHVIPGRLMSFLFGDSFSEADIRNSHPSIILSLLRSILPNADAQYPRIARYISEPEKILDSICEQADSSGEYAKNLLLGIFTDKHSGRGVNRQVRTMWGQAGSAVSAGGEFGCRLHSPRCRFPCPSGRPDAESQNSPCFS